MAGAALMLILGLVCFACMVAVVGWVFWYAVVRSRPPPFQPERWSHLSGALGLREVRPLPDGRLEGQVDGLTVAVELCLVSDVTTGDVALGVMAIAAAESPGSSSVVMTFVRSELHPPLDQPILLVHTGAALPPSSDRADREVAGHDNPLADSVHRVRAADVAGALSLLGQLRERGGVVDLEAGGWRISFTECEVVFERNGQADEASVRSGIESARELISRLRGRPREL